MSTRHLDLYMDEIKDYMASDMTPEDFPAYQKEITLVKSLKEERVQKAAEERKKSEKEGETGSFIDTTYAVEEIKKDGRSRGFVCLLLSLILTALLAGFAGMYIFMVRTGKAQAFEQLGAMYPQPDALIWCACMAAGLLFNMIAAGTRGPAASILAALSYIGAGVIALVLLHLPAVYLGLSGLQAVLCLIAAIRKGTA